MRADREPDGSRWSFYRDLGDTRLVVIDSRAGRVLDPGQRSMLDRPSGSGWRRRHRRLRPSAAGHVAAVAAVPALHDLEAWNEAVCDGAWGKPAAWAGEKVRQAVDLEHWAAFRESFTRLGELQRAVGAGERGHAAGHHPDPVAATSTTPTSRRSRFKRGSGVKSAVYQAVCSPFRNPLDQKERRVIRSTMHPGDDAPGPRRCAGRRACADPEVRWRQVGRRPVVRQPVRHPDDRRPQPDHAPRQGRWAMTTADTRASSPSSSASWPEPEPAGRAA